MYNIYPWNATTRKERLKTLRQSKDLDYIPVPKPTRGMSMPSNYREIMMEEAIKNYKKNRFQKKSKKRAQQLSRLSRPPDIHIYSTKSGDPLFGSYIKNRRIDRKDIDNLQFLGNRVPLRKRQGHHSKLATLAEISSQKILNEGYTPYQLEKLGIPEEYVNMVRESAYPAHGINVRDLERGKRHITSKIPIRRGRSISNHDYRVMHGHKDLYNMNDQISHAYSYPAKKRKSLKKTQRPIKSAEKYEEMIKKLRKKYNSKTRRKSN